MTRVILVIFRSQLVKTTPTHSQLRCVNKHLMVHKSVNGASDENGQVTGCRGHTRLWRVSVRKFSWTKTIPYSLTMSFQDAWLASPFCMFPREAQHWHLEALSLELPVDVSVCLHSHAFASSEFVSDRYSPIIAHIDHIYPRLSLKKLFQQNRRRRCVMQWIAKRRVAPLHQDLAGQEVVQSSCKPILYYHPSGAAPYFVRPFKERCTSTKLACKRPLSKRCFNMQVVSAKSGQATNVRASYEIYNHELDSACMHIRFHDDLFCS